MPYDPFPSPIAPSTQELSRYIQDELRRIADQIRILEMVDGFGFILNTERLLGEGKLYAIDYSPIDGLTLPFTIDIHTNIDEAVFVDISVVSYDSGGADNLLRETFIGGTVTGGTPVISRPLNSDAPDSRNPASAANEGSTVSVPGTPIAVSAGASLANDVAIVPPDSEFYITFSQLGGGQPPTDIQLTFKLAVVDPYPKTAFQP